MLDIIFPRVCPFCKAFSPKSEDLCSTCLGGIKFLSDWSFCRVCGIPFGYYSYADEENSSSVQQSSGNMCGKCVEGRFCFEKARSITIYEGKLRDMIIGFKYEGKLSNANPLLDIMAENFPRDFDDFDSIVPVPLHIDKLRQREYNQSAVLVNGLAKEAGVKSELFGLKKIRHTRAQIEISNEAERRKNVRGAFSVSDPRSFEGKSVLVVDDVFTTGATSDECSKMLLNSGAYKVQVLTLARARAV